MAGPRLGLDRSDLPSENPLRRLHPALGPAAFAVVSFIVLWPFARLDFDRHHDGYMLAQAVAVHQGELIHADAFAQYGPVTPWLQSLALFLPMGPGLALRTINVIFIAATAFLLADMGRRTPRGWPVSRAAGWWAAVAWIVLADQWLGIPMHAWPSTLAALLSVGVLYFFTRSLRCAEDGSARAAASTAVSGGICLGLLPFTRINVGLSACAVCIVVAVLVLITERGAKRRSATWFVLGVLASILTVAAVLAGTGSLVAYYSQSVTWPLTWGQQMVARNEMRGLAQIFLVQAPPVALVGAVMLVQSRSRTPQQGWSVTRSGAKVFTILVGLIIVAWENVRLIVDSDGRISWKTLDANPFSYLSLPNNEYLFFFLVLLVSASVLACVVHGFKYTSGLISRGDTSSTEVTPWLLLGGLTLSGFTQVVPTWDPKHIWWGLPVGLLLVFAVVGATSDLQRPSGNPLALPLLLTAVMAISSASNYVNLEKEPGKPGTIIEGMYVKKDSLRQINQDAAFLGRNLRGSNSVIYLANDGDLSVLDGRYRSADSFFVQWGGASPLQTRITNGNPIVVQKSALSEDTIHAIERSGTHRVVARSPRLVVLRPLDKPVG